MAGVVVRGTVVRLNVRGARPFVSFSPFLGILEWDGAQRGKMFVLQGSGLEET